MTTIEMRVRNMYAGLSKSEQIAANYFLQHKEHIFSYPLATLSQMSGTSQGAWVRFCKNIGFDGLKGLKNSLYLETSQANGADEGTVQTQFSDIRECTSISAAAEHVCANSTPSDAALIFSNSGETEEILRIADTLRATGTPTAAVTRYNSNNSLSRKADYVLYTNSTEILKRSGATSSRIAQLCLADILFMALASRDYKNMEDKLERSYASCHPPCKG